MTTTIPIATQSAKPLSRVERTKSFLKASLIKKWKSSKELFTRPLASFTNNNHQNHHHHDNVKTSRKQFDSNIQTGKFINEKVLDNLDEFERNFLLSAGRKILVRELRKNFEKPQSSVSNVATHNDKVVTVIVTNNSMPNGYSKQKKYSDACVQTTPNDQHQIKLNKASIKATAAPPPPPSSVAKKNSSIQSRHSFYNTYRTEYCPWQNNNYASNLSLISCGVASQREKTLEKTLNKYRNSIKSSSAVDLTSISTVVLETSKSINVGAHEKPHYSSIINISHSNENLTDTPMIVDYRYDSNEPKRNCQLKQTHSMKCMSYMEPLIRFRNNDDDTKSMIITNTTSSTNYLYDNNGTQIMNKYPTKSCSDFGGSNVSLFSVNMDTEPYYNNSESICHNYELPSPNCHKRYDNNSTIGINTDYNKHDGNNNMTTTATSVISPPITTATTTKLRKCFSINQIDLNLLKNELDEYIDRELRTTNFGKNTLAHRRLQLENSIKKVKKKLNFVFSLSLSSVDKGSGKFYPHSIQCKQKH